MRISLPLWGTGPPAPPPPNLQVRLGHDGSQFGADWQVKIVEVWALES